MDSQALNTRIQVLEAVLASKDQEIKNLQNTLTQVLSALNPVANTNNSANELRFIQNSNLVIRGEITVSLTSREYVIMSHLFANKEKACTREELLENFKDSPDMTARNIDVHVFSLRKKLHKVDLGVETVWGIGYKIVA
jgi:DNA-binding response OmpR family regulator